MNLSDLILFLESIGASPNKGLSQNFLIDTNITRKIVKTADIQPGDNVLEIGPGPGALTEILLEQGAHVFAVEKDPKLATALHRFQTPDQRLHVFCEDALDFSLEKVPAKLKVVANLPYHITTPLLEKFFENNAQFLTLTIMMQLEVASRLGAKPSTPEYSSLTLFTQFYTSVLSRFNVPLTCFYPRPKIVSTVVHLKMETPPLVDPAPFFALVRRAFQQRRKMMRASLKELFPREKIENALIAIGMPFDARPEALSLDAWLKFFKEIK